MCFRIPPLLPGVVVPPSISCNVVQDSETFVIPMRVSSLAYRLCRINPMLVVYFESAKPHEMTDRISLNGGIGGWSVLHDECLFFQVVIA